VRVLIIGEGNQEHPLKELSHKLHVESSIEFIGFVSHEKLSSYYRSSHVFVLPSKNEGMSNTILEAMASGLPIITTNTGGTQELIHENGILIPPENAVALSNAILKYIQHPDLVIEHGNKSRQIAGSLSWNNVAKEYFHIYKEMIK
jgi:glycosyltransferase involved in cell wall biosynthesis